MKAKKAKYTKKTLIPVQMNYNIFLSENCEIFIYLKIKTSRYGLSLLFLITVIAIGICIRSHLNKNVCYLTKHIINEF